MVTQNLQKPLNPTASRSQMLPEQENCEGGQTSARKLRGRARREQGGATEWHREGKVRATGHESARRGMEGQGWAREGKGAQRGAR